LRFGNDRDGYQALWTGAARHLAHAPSDSGLGVAPHSLRAVSRGDLAWVAGLAPHAPIHIHVAEQLAEVAEVEAAYGARPVEWLLAHHDLSPRWCLIHATQMETSETEAMARSGAVAGLCPITEANLGDGIFDGARYLSAGGVFGIGSDSNVRISLCEELRLYEYSQRLALKGRAILASADKSAGRTLYDGALKGGAIAAGRATGGLAVGLWADLLALDVSGPDFEGREGDAILDTFIFAADDRRVRHVWSAGREIVRDGRHIARERVQDRFGAVMRGLRNAL
jgi:formimidoylglutamate deiminase